MNACRVVVLLVPFLVSVFALAGDPAARCPSNGGFMDAWVLVQLASPIPERLPDGSYPLDTGFADVDALIRDTGVHRIEHALPTAMRDPRDPEALARHGLDRTYKVFVPAGTDIQALALTFEHAANVVHATPDSLAFPADAVFPNDPRFDEQWSLHNTGQDPPKGTVDADIDAPEGWDISVGSEEVLIAILDTGIDSDHEDLVAKIEPGYDFVDGDDDPEDEGGHGTRTASNAAASTNSGLGMAAPCWNCRILPVRVTPGGGVSAFADGVVWSVDQGARVLNASLGFTYSDDPVVRNAVSYAYDAGAILVSISHNENKNDIPTPAMYAETITLGATDADDLRWIVDDDQGSSYGWQLDLVAPGVSILCAKMGGGYQRATGTSRAAPLTSGVVGVMESVYPALGRYEIRHVLTAGADDEVGDPLEDTPGFDVYHGWGRLNMHRTLVGVEASTTLRVEGNSSTRLHFETANPLADSYDFVRGDIAALSESWSGVELGRLVCLEDDSEDPDTTGHEDPETPAAGEGFFYLARSHAAPGAGSYGGSTQNRDRVVREHPDWIGESDQAGARMGFSVNPAGDVNGDGYDDVIVGAYLYSNGEASEGAAFVYLGSESGLGSTPDWTVEGDQAGAQFGWSVASAGDVNHDGYDDVLVGAYRYSAPEVNEGRVFLYLGSAAGLSESPAWTAEGDQAGAAFGISVSPAGDVNGDGTDDVLVGANYFDGDLTNEGRAYLYLGTGSGLSDTPAWTEEGDQLDARYGRSVAGGGDIDADGYADFVVSAPLYDNPETDEGRLFVYLGSAAGPVAAGTREVDVIGAKLGGKVAMAGDVDGDGYDDVISGAYAYTNGESQEGGAFVYLGSAIGLDPDYAWHSEGDQPEAYFGRSVGGAGDLNGDGYADVVVGASRLDGARSDEGKALVFLGEGAGVQSTPQWFAWGGQTWPRFGRSVAGAGDVNGDGADDLIIGAYLFDDGESDEGGAFVFHGPPEDPLRGDCPR